MGDKERYGAVTWLTPKCPINTEQTPSECWSEAQRVASKLALELGWQSEPIAALLQPSMIYDPLVAEGKVGEIKVWTLTCGGDGETAELVRFLFQTEQPPTKTPEETGEPTVHYFDRLDDPEGQ